MGIGFTCSDMIKEQTSYYSTFSNSFASSANPAKKLD